MKFSSHQIKRYKDLTLLYFKYAQPRMTSRLAFAGERHPGVSGNGHSKADELPDDRERLGPTFVKLGQLLSSRADLLPEEYLQPLSRLQDKVKPFPVEEVKRSIESELGTRLSKIFPEFDEEPLAAASLGQVHRARLRDGREVVVKVQRPNIAQQIADDFAALREIARLLYRHTKVGQRYQFEKIIEELETTLTNELDYRREAANLVTVGNNLKCFSRIQVPQPINDFTTHKILTMEHVDGKKITEINHIVLTEIDGGILAEELFQAYLKQVLVGGTFHADPHPGNIFLTRDNRIALLDLGMVGHTPPAMQENLLKLLLAIADGESDQATDIAIRISATRENFDEMDFRHKIGLIVAEQRDAQLRQLDIGKSLLEVGRTAADTGLNVPMELTLLGKTLLQLDQVGQILAPEFDPNESVRRNATSLLNERMKVSFSEGKVFSSLLEAKEFFGALPSRLNKILDAVGNAELNVKVKPTETRFVMESFEKVANRITTGLVLAALIIGAALLMNVQTSFQLFGYPGLAMLCFLFAAGGGFWLLLNILWQDHKSKRRARH